MFVPLLFGMFLGQGGELGSGLQNLLHALSILSRGLIDRACFNFYTGEWVVSVGKVEQGMSGGGVGLVSILEGGEQQPEWPISLSVVNEHSKVVLNFLIDSLRLSVCLRVVCSAWGSFDVELFVQIFNKHRYEDRSAVRNNLPRDTMHTDNMLDE